MSKKEIKFKVGDKVKSRNAWAGIKLDKIYTIVKGPYISLSTGAKVIDLDGTDIPDHPNGNGYAASEFYLIESSKPVMQKEEDTGWGF